MDSRVKILLNCNKSYFESAVKDYPDIEFGQFLNPTSRRQIHTQWAYDNGCFKGVLNYDLWIKGIKKARSNTPLFIVMPDRVGNKVSTLRLFHRYLEDTEGLPRAFVLQDNMNPKHIPYEHIDTLFVGGSTRYKESKEAIKVCRDAKDYRGIKIHVGRINTPRRMQIYRGVTDSIDGTGLALYRANLDALIRCIRGK